MLDFLHLNWFISVLLKSEDIETLSPADFHILKGTKWKFEICAHSGQVYYSFWFQLPTGLLEPVSPGEEQDLLSSKP